MLDVHQGSELETLKNLLFEDELQHLEEIASKLQTLEIETKNIDKITQTVLEHFDDIFLKKLAQKESKTIEVLSQYLSTIITKSASSHETELSHSLQSVISPAITKEIENNKTKMIDALYPIMGGMISKYVTQAIKEMMDNINTKIEDGLSFEKYKRKIKSKVSGVSETELLLEESSDALISSLFIIHKESGLLIAEAHLENQEIDDPHMVASMASAIKDFINDWIQKNEEESSVQLVSYGKETLYIESAGSVYIIAFLDAEPDYEQRSKINIFFAKLVKKYSHFFQTFNGDDSALEIKILSKRMQDFLGTQKEKSSKDKKQKKNFAKYIFIFLAFLLLFYLYGWIEEYYNNYRLEKSLFKESRQHIEVTQIDEKIHLSGHISSMDQYYNIKQLMKDKEFVNKLDIPIEDIDNKILKQNKTLLKLKKEIEKLDNKFSLLEKNYIQTNNKLQKEQMKTKSIQKLYSLQERILNNLKKAFPYNNALQLDDSSLDFKNKKLFNVGDINPKEDSIKKLIDVFETYIDALMKDKEVRPYIKHIILEGYTDSSGEYEHNKMLSLQRANLIKDYLLKSEVSKKYILDDKIHTKGLANLNPIIKNGIEDAEASRRIKIRFELDKEKIINSIKKILND